MIEVRCPNCDQRLRTPAENANQQMRCPKCNATILVPAEPRVATSKKSSTRRSADDVTAEQSLARPAKKIDHEDLIDMTAMVDIVFFLLIFFLVTSISVVQSSVSMPRPEAHGDEGGASSLNAQMPESNSSQIVVRIGKSDSIEIDGVVFNDLADLAVRLRQIRIAEGADTEMMVIGHAEATHGAAVSVLDTGYEAGINRLRLAVIDSQSDE